MKKTITLLTILMLVLFMVGCENSINPIQPNTTQQASLAKQTQIENERTSLARAAKVDVCHRNANGEYITINVSENAYDAHIAHGDMAPGWHVGETWVLNFNGVPNSREFRHLVQDAEGNVSGEYWWLTGGIFEYGGTLIGTVIGNSLQLNYDRAPIPYKGVFDGVIGENVITDGTYTHSDGRIFPYTATGLAAFGCE